jgi:type II secretory pathway predicted ATPase ExeA
MYEDYYRFGRQPFSSASAAEYPYESKSQLRVLEQLLWGIRRREGIQLLTGDAGIGKTTTAHALLHLLDRDICTAFVQNSFLSEDELLRVLLQDFGVVSDGRALRNASWQSRVETLNRFLRSRASVGASALVVVDEAQNLASPVLEQLRILTALEVDQQNPLQVLLVGLPVLQTQLKTVETRYLDQRIARRCTLRPLGRDEVEEYVNFQIQRARGVGDSLFTARALDLIYQFSEGVPRRINQICDRSLKAGFAVLSPIIDETLVTDGLFAGLGPASVSISETQSAGLRRRLPRHSRRAPKRFRVEPATRRWIAAAAGVLAGVGIGAALTVLTSWTPRTEVDVSPSPRSVLAAGAPPEPVEFVAEAWPEGPSYSIRTVEYETQPAAEAAAAILVALGAPAAVIPPERLASGFVVWVGPYASLVDARLMEAELRQPFGFPDARIEAGGIPTPAEPVIPSQAIDLLAGLGDLGSLTRQGNEPVASP